MWTWLSICNTRFRNSENWANKRTEEVGLITSVPVALEAFPKPIHRIMPPHRSLCQGPFCVCAQPIRKKDEGNCTKFSRAVYYGTKKLSGTFLGYWVKPLLYRIVSNDIPWDCHDMLNMTQGTIGQTVSHLTRPFHATQTRRRGGLRSPSASCFENLILWSNAVGDECNISAWNKSHAMTV